MHRFTLSLAFSALIFFTSTLCSQAQLISGPMIGHTELRSARIWAEVKPGSVAEIWYWKKGQKESRQKLVQATSAQQWYTTVIFDLVNLEINTEYEYALTVSGKSERSSTPEEGQFRTAELWQWRYPAPDFSFLTGSCAYLNEAAYDRPGTPYGKDSSIFETMAKERAAFMLWLGDNWYLRESDFFGAWGLWYRASRDRSFPVLHNFLKAMPHYAIWDDHDYGPNDADKSYVFKEESRKVFMNYWANPSYGFNGEGIYTKMSYNDCDFFLLDDRSFRSPDDMEPMINGRPNPSKRMFGKEQLEWLKAALIQSKSPFKFIVTGSQTLNPVSPYDCLQDYPAEFQELMQFLSQEKISGVLFLTGDRHHSEVIRYDRVNSYPLYDITSSPLTSGVGRVFDKEKENPARVPGTLVEAQNYTRISVSGKPRERVLKVEFLGIKGEVLGGWTIAESALKHP